MKKKEKRKLSQHMPLSNKNKNNERKIIFQNYLLQVIVILGALIALLSAFMNPIGYDFAKGWGFYEWLLQK
ncbi:MAG: hypothetical protein LBR52_02825 [Prevotellaceae bacterium]|jgi:preprotein translocase subunit Sec63|nr:hypothetical protein [Prevotellaceae bacterium]